jgi:diguanylate cyclase (GGDEF)-like protein/PAS domain S-box-containing protein
LEIFIVLTGIAIGAFLYRQTSLISAGLENARSFDQATRETLVSVSIANLSFNELIEGNSKIDLEKDVYSQLDTAASLCGNIDKGGPGGNFIPTPIAPEPTNQDQAPLCGQLQTFRSLIQQRWEDHQAGKTDSQKAAYEASYEQVLQSMQRFDNMADPHMQEANAQTRQKDLELCIGLAGIFLVIAAIIWRTRKMMSGQTKQLEAEIEQRTRLNTELDAERNLVNTLIDNLPDAVFAKDSEDRFLIVNLATARLLGATQKEDLIGKTEAAFQPADVAERLLADDSHILETGEMLLNHQEFFIDTNTGNPHWRQTTKVPLRDRTGQITGLVGISRDITRQKETEDALKMVNDKLTAGIVALEQSTHETEILSEMVDLLQACPTTEEACVVIADQLSKFFPEDSGMLYLFHASRNILDKVASWGPTLPDPAVFKPDDCWGLRRGRMHIIEENMLRSSQPGSANALVCPHITPNGPADYLCVPLVAQGEALGLLHLRHQVEVVPGETGAKPVEWYHHAKRQRIHTIVDSLSLSLANLKLRSTLRQQSIRDPLTGMFNRRYMEETLEREILRAERNNETLGVIMLDIDHFKQFNDTFGHQAGDALLTALGHFFLSNIRGEDVACRYGGEEFILLLLETSMEKTCERAEELRDKVRYVNVAFQGQSLGTVTLSLGVSVFPQHGSTSELLIQAADQALYRAKVEGRDRVVVA